MGGCGEGWDWWVGVGSDWWLEVGWDECVKQCFLLWVFFSGQNKQCSQCHAHYTVSM